MKKTKIHVTRINPTVQLFCALAIFVVATYLSKARPIANWEIAQFQFIYNLPDFLRPLFIVTTQFGSIYVLGLLLLIYLMKKHYHIVLRLLMTGLLAYLISGFAKDIWGRVRPSELLLDITNLDFIVRGPGYPSGHMALATALALTLGHYLPRKYYWMVITWIIGVGLSRMYLGVHFPLDVVGGFAIGWGSYALFRHVRLYDISFARKRIKKAHHTAPVSKNI